MFEDFLCRKFSLLSIFDGVNPLVDNIEKWDVVFVIACSFETEVPRHKTANAEYSGEGV